MAGVISTPPPQTYSTQAKPPDNSACGALDQIPEILEQINKASSAKSAASFFTSFLSQILPSQFNGLVGNETLTPDQIPMGVVSSFGASILMDVDIASNLIGLWQNASSSSSGDVSLQSSNLDTAFQIFAQALSAVPQTVVDTQGIMEAKSALESFILENKADASLIEGQLNQVLKSLGVGSELIFDLQKSGDILKSSVLDLAKMLDNSSMILGSADVAIRDSSNLSGKSINTSFTKTGTDNVQKIAEILNGINTVNLNSPDSIGQISVLGQAGKMIDDLYRGSGNGSVNWDGLTSHFAGNVATQDMIKLSNEVRNFTPFIGSDISNPIFGIIDEALFAAFRNGGSDNLAKKSLLDLKAQLNKGVAAASAVATIYSIGKTVSSDFAHGMNTMRQVGAGGAYESVLSGNLAKFLNMNPIDILSVGSQIADMRTCGKDSLSSIAPALLEGFINKFAQQSNVYGHMLVGSGDAAGYFLDAIKKFKISTDKAKQIVSK